MIPYTLSPVRDMLFKIFCKQKIKNYDCWGHQSERPHTSFQMMRWFHTVKSSKFIQRWLSCFSGYLGRTQIQHDLLLPIKPFPFPPLLLMGNWGMQLKTSEMLITCGRDLNIDEMCSNVDRNMVICTQERKLPVTISVMLYGFLIARDQNAWEKQQQHGIISSNWKAA